MTFLEKPGDVTVLKLFITSHKNNLPHFSLVTRSIEYRHVVVTPDEGIRLDAESNIAQRNNSTPAVRHDPYPLVVSIPHLRNALLQPRVQSRLQIGRYFQRILLA